MLFLSVILLLYHQKKTEQEHVENTESKWAFKSSKKENLERPARILMTYRQSKRQTNNKKLFFYVLGDFRMFHF